MATNPVETRDARQPIRRQFSLGPDAVARLAALEARTGATSQSEVIRHALRVYEYLSAEEAEGHRILVDQGGGNMVQLKIL